MDTVFVEAIEFYAYHGVSDEEQAVGHRYCVDVELDFDTSHAAATDHLADTISYAAVARRIAEIGRAEQVRLIETLAERMVAQLLAEFPADVVRLSLRKLKPPMNVIAEAAGVSIERRRTT